MTLIRDRFRALRCLRETQYGAILLCRDELVQPPRRVVLKRVSLRRAALLLERQPARQAPDDPRKEKAFAALMRDVPPHPHIVRYLDDFVDGQWLYFVLEHCAGGDLSAIVTQDHIQGRMDCADALGVLRQLAQGIAFLHERGVAHRDLSLENVLLARGGQCKIADFGRCVRADQPCVDCTGNSYYIAPEVAAAKAAYDPRAADIWSLGVVLFVLLTGSPLVPLASESDPAFRAIKETNVRAVLEAWQLTPLLWDSAVELLEGMLKCDPAERLTVAQVLQHRALADRANRSAAAA